MNKSSNRWLVTGNCQIKGLSECLSYLNPGITIELVNVSKFLEHKEHLGGDFSRYERMLMSPDIINSGLLDAREHDGIILLPEIYFDAYQPDQCWVHSNKGPVSSPLFHYHSRIAISAYLKGLSEADTCKLYNKKVYLLSGYFRWKASRDNLIERYAKYGWNIASYFRRWSMRGCFMYSTNHPNINVLFDLAREATIKGGSIPANVQFVPPDTLALGGCFPVYGEIADDIGVEGSYIFKKAYEHKTINLEEFVRDCFSEYKKYDRQELKATEGLCPDAIFS